MVVGDVGDGQRRERLALGETPNVAARLQGLAELGTMVISGATHRLVGRLFDCRSEAWVIGPSAHGAVERFLRTSTSSISISLLSTLPMLSSRSLFASSERRKHERPF